MTKPYPPIGFLKELTHWETIPIVECGEPLIPLSRLPGKYFVPDPRYFKRGIPGAPNECFARAKVFDLLVAAARNLPRGYKFVIWDAWRPVAVQGFLFHEFLAELTRQNPDKEIDTLEKEARQFVTPPFLDEQKPPPHFTGGAIDISLIDAMGNELDMKTAFDDFSIESNTRYFEEKYEAGAILSPAETVYRDNRRLLYHLLTQVGFTNYPKEWWHYDFGNQFWACSTQNKACYGGGPAGCFSCL